jgi:Dyp-type peroxidase family
MADLNLQNIQGNILRGYTFPIAKHVFFQITEASEAKAFLRTLQIQYADDWGSNKPRSAFNVALSHSGLEKLAGKVDLGDAYPAFVQGMGARARDLGDDLGSREKFWDSVDVWIAIHGQTENDASQQLRTISSARPGMKLVQALSAAALRGDDRDDHRYEHFGFRDGISNPAIAGVDESANAGSGTRQDGRWIPVAAGEFVLGQSDESGDGALPAHSAELFEDGTFVVFRDLQQNVWEFRNFLRKSATEHGISEDELAARLMGRCRDGSPLVPPDSSNGDLDEDDAENGFSYGRDQAGSKCPLGAHIRRINPRDARDITRLIARHRILRRGMPYGPRAGEQQDTERRGLYFIAMNANIERQFEFLQKMWLNGRSGASIAADLDPIASQVSGRAMIIPGDVQSGRDPKIVGNLPMFVQCRGGQYFLMPSKSALERLIEPDGPNGKSN